MPLTGDAYTLGVRLTGDITSLRQELQQGTQVISGFATASTEAMNRAAAAMERAAGAMQSSGERVRRSTEAPQRSLPRTASSFEDYMRRATKAQEEVARTSEAAGNRTTRSLEGIGSVLGRLTGVGGFVLLARQAWETGIGFHEFTQNTEVALTTLLGTQEAAKGFLADILAFAKETPYAFTNLTDQAQKLLTYGFQTEQIIPILRATGDAATAMGKGTEGVERLNRALGQIQAKGRLQSEELLQMNEIGVNGLAILANQADMTTIEYQKLVTAGLVPAEEAIAGLVKGITEGTDGVNGQTAAFGGLMAQIKGSGGITATLDSTRTAVRNASAEVTKSLVPAFTGFLGVAQQGLGVVQDTARVFNGLPDPVQSSALAFGATAIAMRLLNVQARATGAWSSLRGSLATSRVQAELLGYRVDTLRGRLTAAAITARSFGPALLGAFGGPVGLAIAGVTAAVSAFAATSADGKARADSYAESVKLLGEEAEQAAAKIAVENLVSGDNADWGWYQRWTTGYQSAADAIEGVGLNLEEVGRIISGPQADFDAYIARLKEMKDTADSSDWDALEEIRVKIVQQRNALERQRLEQEQLNRAQDEGTAGVRAQAGAYDAAASSIRVWSDEQTKALDAAAEAARKAFQPNVGALDLNLATEDDVAQAREKVEDATRRLRDAEDDRAEKLGKDKITASERRRAEESVAEARKALQEATEELGETEARNDPVAQYRKRIEQMLEDSRTFVRDIQTLADQGLNAIDLQQIINAGPEGSADVRKALLGDPGMVDFTNEARETIEALTAEIEVQSRLTQASLEGAGKNLAGELGLAMRIEAEAGAHDTIASLAAALEVNPERVFQVGRAYGLQILAGMADAMDVEGRLLQPAPGGGWYHGPGTRRAYASGGIYPGYTPGRDVGLIAVSGGEAIMRPEWTRAVGADRIHRWNAAARAGEGAIRAEMARYLGGYANGGTVPQVVTVPVRTENTTHAPWTIQNAVFTDPEAAKRWGARSRASWTGGRRG